MANETLKQNIPLNLPDINSVLEGTVLEKKKKYLYVDLSPYGIGVIRGPNYLEAKDYIKQLNPNDKVLVRILEWNNEEGNIELALKDASQENTWKKIYELRDSKTTFPLLITDANVGGLIGKLYRVQGFIPVSQLSSEHYPKVEGGSKAKILEKLKEFVGKELMVQILDADQNTNKLIFSEKLVELDQIKEIAKKYKIGDIVKVKITKIVNFGAFVKVDDTPVDGLIHISEISSAPNVDIKKILQEGEVKEAKITNIDDGKISLSLKALESKKEESKKEESKSVE
ncbi:MAG: S1 RNA-binding domain-containing protein [Minisyncoccia bacterium]